MKPFSREEQKQKPAELWLSLWSKRGVLKVRSEAFGQFTGGYNTLVVSSLFGEGSLAPFSHRTPGAFCVHYRKIDI